MHLFVIVALYLGNRYTLKGEQAYMIVSYVLVNFSGKNVTDSFRSKWNIL